MRPGEVEVNDDREQGAVPEHLLPAKKRADNCRVIGKLARLKAAIKSKTLDELPYNRRKPCP